MQFVPRPVMRNLALSLTSLHLSMPVLIGIVAYDSIEQPAQALPTLPPPTFSPDTRPTPLEIIQQARQRLQQSVPPGVPLAPQFAPQSELSAPPLSSPAGNFNLYRLGPSDVVSIYVQRFADFSFQAAIDQEGKITHPLLGKVALQGLTIDEAQERVRLGVNRFVIDPIVLVSLANQRPVQVTVVGEIGKPGLYPITGPTGRVSSVLFAAGGVTERADLRAVKVRRVVGAGASVDETIDLYTPLRDGTTLPDLRLQDGDTIVIPTLKPEDQGQYDRSVVAKSTLVKPQLIVRVLSYARGGLSEITVPNGSRFVDAFAKVGFNPDAAAMRKVAVVRFDVVQQRAITLTVDGKRALLGDAEQNIALQDNDVIIINRNLVGRITYALNIATQPFRDVLGFLLFFKQLSNSAANLFGPEGSSK